MPMMGLMYLILALPVSGSMSALPLMGCLCLTPLMSRAPFYLSPGLDLFGLSLDFLSSAMVVLSLISTATAILTQHEVSKSTKSPNSWFLLLALVLVASFTINSFIGFYFFFELSLIPMLVLLVGWGYQPERWSATSHLMMYTIASSLPLLVACLWLSVAGGLTLTNVAHAPGPPAESSIMAIVALVGFLVKCPVFFLHLWLPKAHVEASVGGSMVLAAILLKLGSYGIARISAFMAPGLISGVSMAALSGGVCASFLCTIQMDAKVLIAYSSVGHMSLCVACSLWPSPLSIQSLILISVAHGLSSALMFGAAMSFYKISGTRSMLLSKNILAVSPALVLIWFLTMMGCMAAPPTMNLLAEIQGIICIFAISCATSPGLFALAVLSLIYSLMLFTSSSHSRNFAMISSVPANTGPVSLTFWLMLALIFSFWVVWV